MKDKKKLKISPPDGKQKVVKKKIGPKEQEEQERLLYEADSISPINKKINKAEIIELSDGSFLNIDEYVADTYTEPATHFFKSFYNLIADLLGVDRDVMRRFRKIYIVPMLKRKLVYGRFPNAIQNKISLRNPYTGYCTRKYWNYQTLTKKGDQDQQKQGF